MAFISENFSPVGGNARGGNITQGKGGSEQSENSIQVFSYSTEDSESQAQANNYFNELNEAGPASYIRRGDWIQMAANVDSGSQEHSIRFVLGDRSFPCGKGESVNVGGANYADGDLITVIFVDGTIDQKLILEVNGVASGVVTSLRQVDPGFFSVAPTTLTGLATTNDGAGDDNLTVDITLALDFVDADITLSTLSIVQV